MDNTIRSIIEPSIFKRFQCKGADCRYNCCQGWQITMSKTEYHKWKKQGILPKGKQDNGRVHLCPEGKRTERMYAEIILDDTGKCPYLLDDGLCHIQKEYGVKVMTATCRIFPREAHRLLGHVECSLSMGCEKVLELLLEEKEGLTLDEVNPREFEIYGSNYGLQSKRKYPKFRHYYDIQTLSLALLQADEFTMENRLFLLGIAIEHIESLLNEGNSESVAAYIADFLTMVQQTDTQKLLDSFPDEKPLAVFNSVMSALLTLHIPDHFRHNILLKAGTATKLKNENGVENPELEYYCECRKNFARWINGKEYFLENIMVMALLWLNIPFKNPEKSLWENYLYLIWIWVVLKGSLCLSLTEENTDDDMIDYCAILFRQLGHNRERFFDIIEAFQKEGNSLAHVAILL